MCVGLGVDEISGFLFPPAKTCPEITKAESYNPGAPTIQNSRLGRVLATSLSIKRASSWSSGHSYPRSASLFSISSLFFGKSFDIAKNSDRKSPCMVRNRICARSRHLTPFCRWRVAGSSGDFLSFRVAGRSHIDLEDATRGELDGGFR